LDSKSLLYSERFQTGHFVTFLPAEGVAKEDCGKKTPGLGVSGAVIRESSSLFNAPGRGRLRPARNHYPDIMKKTIPPLVLSLLLAGCVPKSDYTALQAQYATLQEHDKAVQQVLDLATAQIRSLERDLANTKAALAQAERENRLRNELDPGTKSIRDLPDQPRKL
jgi:hypothetical protein